MRILRLVVLALACLGGSQVAAGPPWPGNDTSGAMMLAGGRSAEGNRYLGEDGDAQPHRQPQGAAGKNKGA